MTSTHVMIISSLLSAILAMCFSHNDRIYLNHTNIIPSSWVAVGKPLPNTIIEFGILLPQQNIHILENLLHNRSDPKSNNYGQWLSKNTIDNIVSSDTINFEIIHDWLNVVVYNNYTCTHTSDSMYCKTTVTNINKLFKTDMLKYRNTKTNELFYSGRKMGYSLPLYLYHTIDSVLGIGDFPENTHLNMNTKKVKDDLYYVSPLTINHLYNMSNNKNDSKLSSQTVVEFQNDACFNKEDLDYFLNDNGLSNINITSSHIMGVCDMNTTSPDIEASLDIQYQIGVNTKTVEYYISVNDWLYQYANLLYNSTDPPYVNSMSYGWAEKDQCDPEVFPECYIGGDSETYTKRTNIEFLKLSLRGITLLASSGDAGAPGRTSEECDINSPLNPTFPSTSPYVLSVGGSIVMNPIKIDNSPCLLCKNYNCIKGGEELNCNYDRCGWTSGGGFSNYFDRPWWQTSVSDKYLNSAAKFPPNKYFNSQGRVYPDVTLVSHNYIVRVSNDYMAVDGTSASCPSFSGMISKLNNLRLSQNKSTLGLVAPLLYHIYDICKTCFKDIIRGSNNSTEYTNCKYGYEATKGYDAVYGIGLPNFDNIYDFIKNMKN